MTGIAIDRLDQVRDQLRAPPELHINLAPGAVDLLPPPHEPVVADNRERQPHHNDRENDNSGGHEQPFHQPEGTTVQPDQANARQDTTLIDPPTGYPMSSQPMNPPHPVSTVRNSATG
jgi:hypothetical protein